MSNLSDIVFNHINEKYAYGTYGDFKVIMMKKNSYINATKLCSEFNKQLKHWLENKNGKDLIDEVKKEINQTKLLTVANPAVNNFDDIDTNNKEIEPIVTIKGGGKITQIRGTYVHPLLIPHIASWISPVFAIKVSKIVNEFLITEYKNKLLEKEQENLSLINKMDIMLKKMDEQNKKMDEQTRKMDEQAKKIEVETRELKEQNNKQIDNLSELQITVNKISNKLNCAHMPDNNELSDRFLVMKSDVDYYFIRAQDRNIYNAIKKQEDKGYKRIKDLIKSESIPNSIYLWNTIKDELIKEGKIKTYRNTFNLNISESDFITIIKSIFDQRKEYN